MFKLRSEAIVPVDGRESKESQMSQAGSSVVQRSSTSCIISSGDGEQLPLHTPMKCLQILLQPLEYRNATLLHLPDASIERAA